MAVPTVNEHLKKICDEAELDRQATIRSFRIVQREGSRNVARNVEHYNLDAILAVGYRVRSARGTAFRQWATAEAEAARPQEERRRGMSITTAELRYATLYSEFSHGPSSLTLVPRQ